MKVFLDFGGNQGQGLREIMAKYRVDESWIIETFEPNPDCRIREFLSDIPNIIINEAAIWTGTGTVDFSKMMEDTQGSSVECLMNDGVCMDPASPSFRHHDHIVQVPCVDISEVLNRYKDAEFLLVKMDIEGSEFPVLRKALDDGSITCVNDLYVEWHHMYVRGESDHTTNELKARLTGMGVRLGDWK